MIELTFTYQFFLNKIKKTPSETQILVIVKHSYLNILKAL